MRLAAIKKNGAEIAGIVTPKGVLPVAALNEAKGTSYKTDMMSLIQAGEIPVITAWYNNGGKAELDNLPGLVPQEEVVYAPLYRNPKRIFGIGLNYVDHAGDIGSAAPTGPEDHRRGGAGHHYGQGLPGRIRGELAGRHCGLYHHPGHDRGVHPQG